MKKKLLRLCSIVLVISMVLGNLVSMPVAAESTEETTGMTFSEYRKGVIDAPFETDSNTMTVEATIKLSEDASSYDCVILSARGKSKLPELNFGIRHLSGKVRPWIYYCKSGMLSSYNAYFDYDFLAKGNYSQTHLTFVLGVSDDGTTTTVACYVDGVEASLAEDSVDYTLSKEEPSKGTQPVVLFDQPTFAYCVGGDYATDQSARYFKGEIYSIATYTDVRTTDEITADKDGIDDMTDENLMAYYDLTSVTDATTKVANGSNTDSNQQYALNVVETWMTERKPALSDWDKENDDFSIVLVGDTQIATDYDVLNGYTDGETGVVSGIYDWIIENKEAKNIQFVMGLGDIVQDSPYAYYDGDDEDSKPDEKDDSIIESEWDYAMNQIQKLDAAEIPYSLIRGNHDQQSKYIENVTYEYYKDSIDGSLDENMLNTWQELVVNDIKYLILCLDLGASDTELEWAEEVIKTHPYHNVIITTHAYMDSDGTTLDEDGTSTNDSKYYPSQYPSQLYPKETYGRNDGGAMWDECFSKYDNVVMIVSGHIGVDDVEMTPATGVNGNTVAQLLVDPQDLDVNLAKTTTDDRNMPTGMVCILNISADGKTVQVEQYSTAYGEYYMNTSQFTFEMNVIQDANQKLLFDDKQMTVKLPNANGTSYRTFGYNFGGCATAPQQIILSAGYTNVISYCAPSDGLIRVTDMKVGFYGSASQDGYNTNATTGVKTAREVEFAITNEDGKILLNTGDVLVFNPDKTLAQNMSIEAQEIQKGESIYFVFHGVKESSNVLQCASKIEFSDDDGKTWTQVNTNTTTDYNLGYHVPWPADTETYDKDDVTTAKQGQGGFFYQFSEFYEKTDYSETDDRVVIHSRRMSDVVTDGTTTTPFIYNSVYTCTTKYNNIIAAAGFTNVISYEAPETGKIWIDNLYVYCATEINSETGVVAEAEFSLIDENGNILSNDGKVYSVKAETDDAIARDSACNLAPVLLEVKAGERIYFVFHGITATPDMRCNVNIQFCADGATTWTTVSDYTTAGGQNINTLRDPDSTSISDISQGKGNFYYEYTETYIETDKIPEFIHLGTLTNMTEAEIHASFPYEQPAGSAYCMTSKSEIISSAGYTNVISYKVPETGLLYVGGENYTGMKVWVNNAKEGLKSEFAVLDETGKILTNGGQKYVFASSTSGASVTKAAAQSLSFSKYVTKGEMIYFVFHGLEGNTQSLRCNAKIWLSSDDGVNWTQMNDAPNPAQVGLYSKNGYNGGGDNAAQTVDAGQGVDGFYYQYIEANTANKSGVTIGDETEGIVTVYSPINLEENRTYCDKYVVDATVDSDNKITSYIDIDMLNIKKQSKDNDSVSDTFDVRYIASVDNLSYQKVGFVFSINADVQTPTIEDVNNEVRGVAHRYTDLVYARVNEDNGSRKVVNLYAEEGCNSRYGFAFEMRKTPSSTTVYARAYVQLSDGTIVYGTPRAVTTPEANTEG